MSRTFWVVVGAIGGIAAYRKGTQAVQHAKELGPLGTAQVAAQATSSLAGRTANGLGRLRELKARREGRLLIGSAQDVPAPAGAGTAAPGSAVPEGWVPAPAASARPTIVKGEE